MTRHLALGAAAVMAAALWLPVRGAALQRDRGRTHRSDVSRADRDFVRKAAEGGMLEVELGRTVSDRATTPEAKDFAQRMVTDHSKANDELKDLASRKSLMVPTTLTRSDARLRDRMAHMSGGALDRAYLRDMVRDHEHDVAEFRREARYGSDPDIKAWAEHTLPTLEEHLRMARDADRRLMGTRAR